MSGAVIAAWHGSCKASDMQFSNLTHPHTCGQQSIVARPTATTRGANTRTSRRQGHMRTKQRTRPSMIINWGKRYTEQVRESMALPGLERRNCKSHISIARPRARRFRIRGSDRWSMRQTCAVGGAGSGAGGHCRETGSVPGWAGGPSTRSRTRKHKHAHACSRDGTACRNTNEIQAISSVCVRACTDTACDSEARLQRQDKHACRRQRRNGHCPPGRQMLPRGRSL